MGAVATKARMDSYVGAYRQRYEAAMAEYQGRRQLVDAASPHDRAALAALRRDADQAKADLDAAWKDYAEAQKHANAQVAKAERKDAAAQNSASRRASAKSAEKSLPGKAVDGIVSAAGVGLLAGGFLLAGGAKLGKKGLDWTHTQVEKTRLAMNNTASYVSMTFAKNILGYTGSGLPADPSRRSWDPAVKRSREKGFCHDPEHQPSLI